MSNISSNINLRQLKSEIRTFKGVSGQIECLVIPIAANHLVKGEKGGIFKPDRLRDQGPEAGS